jgi:hypothetical protein
MRTLAITLVASLTLVAAAAGANSVGFPDPTGDAKLAPDVSRLLVSSDDAGKVTVRAEVPGWDRLALLDAVGILVDVDQNPDTGTLFLGTEYVVEVSQKGLEFWHADGDFFDRALPPASVTAAFEPGAATFTFAASDLGISSGFNVVAVTHNLLGFFEDIAPDYRTFNYQLAPSTSAPPLAPDTRAPFVAAQKSTAVHGKSAELDYEVYDGRGETRETITVFRKTKKLATIAYTLGDASPFYGYYAKWKVPTNVRGALRFCVRAYDRAGNASALSCAPLTVT